MREGYDTPSFFVEILNKGSKAQTKNFAEGGFTIKIIYFQEEKNELDQLEKVDEINELFGMIFCIGERKLTVGEYSHDFIGEYNDILQISIEVDYIENTRRKETAQIAEEVKVKIIQG